MAWHLLQTSICDFNATFAYSVVDDAMSEIKDTQENILRCNFCNTLPDIFNNFQGSIIT